MSDAKTTPGPPYLVIVAEDEVILRMLAADVLTDAGFTVVEVTHAAEALALLQTHAAHVHVLFTDIHMPGTIDGLQLAHHTRGHWPWIGVLIASARLQPTPAELPTGSRFLAKPYECDHMLKHVRELVGAA